MHRDALPAYVSVELSLEEGDIHLARLKELGGISQVMRERPMLALTVLNCRHDTCPKKRGLEVRACLDRAVRSGRHTAGHGVGP